MNFWVIITAAGSGARFSPERPKQYWQVAGKTVLEHSIDLFLDKAWIKQVIVCVAEEDPYIGQLATANHPKIAIVKGAQARWQTVLNGLRYIQEQAQGDDWVLVHDGVRACLHDQDLNRLIMTLKNHAVGGILAEPVKDTMKRSTAEGEISQTIDRNHLWHALTPQMFRIQLLIDAIEHCAKAKIAMTDDASALEQAGFAPKIVSADHPNPKLTYPSDFPYISYLLAQKQVQLC